MSDWKNERRFLAHPDAERFDTVTFETIERWKESELSGDEWRFSHVAKFYSHGRLVAEMNHGSIQRLLLKAAAEWSSIPIPDGLRGFTDDLCCQPGCPEPWTVLMHPKKAYDSAGRRLANDYFPGQVRAFCERHRTRGDCALDDADDNYEVVDERFPPTWTDVRSTDERG